MSVAAAKQPSLQFRFNDQKRYPILPPTGPGIFLFQGDFQLRGGSSALAAAIVIKYHHCLAVQVALGINQCARVDPTAGIFPGMTHHISIDLPYAQRLAAVAQQRFNGSLHLAVRGKRQ